MTCGDGELVSAVCWRGDDGTTEDSTGIITDGYDDGPSSRKRSDSMSSLDDLDDVAGWCTRASSEELSAALLDFPTNVLADFERDGLADLLL